MILKRYFDTLSIHKLGIISSYISAAIILLFAILMINQEYKSYETQLQIIEKEYKGLDKQKQLVLKKLKIDHKKKIMRYVIGVGGVSLFMFFTIYALLRVVSNLIENELELFTRKLETAAKEFHKIDHEDFNFTESKSLIDNTNNLINEIQQSHTQLLQLNSTLEQKVQDKTRKLQKLVAAQDEFIKKSIHEVNTPLSIILTNIDLLKMDQFENKNITNIESASKIINNIFHDLSFMVKKNRVEYPLSIINFSEYLKSRIEYFDEVAKANGLIFITNIQNNCLIYFSDVKLQRIIDNNLSNAIKYSYENSVIYTALHIINSQIVFSIKTNSKKIENLEKIFDDYYRENNVKGGFGIGLNIVKEICDENKVKIEIESNNEETKFTYRFILDENITS